MNELIELLNNIRPDVDFEKEEHLIDDKIFDSLSLVALIARLSDEFDVDITPLDIVPANFQSAKAMWALIEKLSDE